MENQPPQQPDLLSSQSQMPLPNATAVLVLGILSLVGCFCYGVLGLICAIIALVLASKDMRMYMANPSSFTPGSYSNLRAGRVCAIIGLCISIAYFLFVLFIIISVGFEALRDPGHFYQYWNNH